jgi:hypothetical protein
MESRLLSFLNSNNFFSHNQFRFTERKNTESAGELKKKTIFRQSFVFLGPKIFVTGR